MAGRHPHPEGGGTGWISVEHRLEETLAPVSCPSYDGGMLRRLRIENLVLIHEAELELDAGLNAITGETGAGKTIFSNAIGLLLGARGESSLIGAASEEAYVEAEFDLPDDEVIGDAGRAPAGGRGDASWSRGASSPTGARAPMPGGGPQPGRMSPRPSSRCSR